MPQTGGATIFASSRSLSRGTGGSSATSACGSWALASWRALCLRSVFLWKVSKVRGEGERGTCMYVRTYVCRYVYIPVCDFQSFCYSPASLPSLLTLLLTLLPLTLFLSLSFHACSSCWYTVCLPASSELNSSLNTHTSSSRSARHSASREECEPSSSLEQ